MGTIRRFEDLDVWKTSRRLTNEVYECTAKKRFDRDFGLRDQIQRAAISVMSNIAEGFESRTQSLFIDFLGRARGSAAEVRSQLYLAFDLDYITQDEFDSAYDLAEKASRQIYRLIEYLESRPNSKRVREEQAEYRIDLDD